MVTSTKTSKLSAHLSLGAGILILIQGIVRLLQSRALVKSGIADELWRRFFAGVALHISGAIAVVLGILIVVGAILLYKHENVTIGGLIVLVSSLLCILSFGLIGLVGLTLGIIGAALALTK